MREHFTIERERMKISLLVVRSVPRLGYACRAWAPCKTMEPLVARSLQESTYVGSCSILANLETEVNRDLPPL